MRRGEALLLEHLDDQQRKEFSQTDCFVVRGRSGRHYVVLVGRSCIYRVDRYGKARAELGVSAPGVPGCDSALALKLALQTKDRHVRMIACSMGVTGWPIPYRVERCLAMHFTLPIARSPRLTPPWRWRRRWAS